MAIHWKLFYGIIWATYLATAEIHRVNHDAGLKPPVTFPDGGAGDSIRDDNGAFFQKIIFAFLATLLVGCAGIAPLLFIPLETGAALRQKGGNAAKTLNKFLSFAVGALLGDVFLHLLPEAYLDGDGSHSGNIIIGLWMIAGIIVFMVIEMIMVDDDDEMAVKESSDNNNDKGIATSGYLNLMANIVDNFTHGLAIGGSYHNSTRLGHLTTLAILLHEIPHEISDFAILLRAGFDRWGAAKAQILTASGSVFGTIVGFHGGAIIGSTSWILPFTSGGFLYISLVNVLPDLMNQEETFISAVKQLAFIFMGLGSMCLVNVLNG